MNAEHERFADWDAAYLLGALSAADRALYETHRAECDRCREAVAEIAPTLGLLARVDSERAASLLRVEESETQGPDAGHRERVISLAGARERRRRRRIVAGVAAAAVVLAAIAIPLGSALMRDADTRVVALEPVAELPLSASVELTDVAWGTRIEMTCAYGEVPDAPADGWSYALVVIDHDGTESVLSTWQARPGSTARLSAGTALPSTGISAVEIRALGSGDVLMRTDEGSVGGD